MIRQCHQSHTLQSSTDSWVLVTMHQTQNQYPTQSIFVPGSQLVLNPSKCLATSIPTPNHRTGKSLLSTALLPRTIPPPAALQISQYRVMILMPYIQRSSNHPQPHPSVTKAHNQTNPPHRLASLFTPIPKIPDQSPGSQYPRYLTSLTFICTSKIRTSRAIPPF